jgi:ribosome recycling factor
MISALRANGKPNGHNPKVSSMAQEDIEIDLDDIERRMDGAMASLKAEFASLRTGRASAAIVEPIQVEAYGQMTPINQLGTVNVPEPRMVVINVWDKGMIAKVEKAIRESGIGINPITDGPLIRLPIPELNEERRRQLTKVAADYAERARVSIRNVRRDGMDQIKKARAAGMSEDDQKMWSDEVQDLTDKAIAAVDRALEAKQAEIMQV